MSEYDTIAATEASQGAEYECGDCGATFQITTLNSEMDMPNNYDLSCPLCGGFRHKQRA